MLRNSQIFGSPLLSLGGYNVSQSALVVEDDLAIEASKERFRPGNVFVDSRFIDTLDDLQLRWSGVHPVCPCDISARCNGRRISIGVLSG